MSVFPILDRAFDVKSLLLGVTELIDPDTAFSDLDYPISLEHPVQYVLGSFGATGLPSLFHQMPLRQLRKTIFDLMLPKFAMMYPGHYIGMLIDRFSIRRKGVNIGGETWHRDVEMQTEANVGDKVFGGWLNLDADGDQTFTCVLGSEGDFSRTGFAKFSMAEMADLEHQKSTIRIPPGHLIVFDQTIAHKISAKKQTTTSFRLYVGWRVSQRPFALSFEQMEHFQLQTAPHLPSGQPSPMYAKLHWTNWRNLLVDFSSRFKAEHLTQRQVGSGPDAGTVLIVVKCPMQGCADSFPAYTESELSLFSGWWVD